jgi:hypothetical protein
MTNIPTTYMPLEADRAVMPLASLADAVYGAVRAIVQGEHDDDAQALRARADSLVDSEPSFAADLYAAADLYRAAAH